MFKKYLSVLSLILLPSVFSAVQARETLTVYAPNSFAASWGPGPLIKQAFEAECDCELKILGLSDGTAVLNRLRMEGKNTQADVILGLDNNLLAAAEKTNLFARHQVDTSSLTLPVVWTNPYFVPFDYSYFAFIYNSEKLKDPPKSLNELVEGKWKIIYQDPRTSTPGFGLLMWMQKVYGDNSDRAWQKLSKNTVTVTKGWSDAYNLFLKGESDLVLSYTTSPIYHITEENDRRYAAAKFSEGHYMQVESAGILTSSKHPQLANRFMQFMLSPTVQQYVISKNSMYPVIEMGPQLGFDSLIKPDTVLQFTPEEVATHRAEWIRSWQNAVSQ